MPLPIVYLHQHCQKDNFGHSRHQMLPRQMLPHHMPPRQRKILRNQMKQSNCLLPSRRTDTTYWSTLFCHSIHRSRGQDCFHWFDEWYSSPMQTCRHRIAVMLVIARPLFSSWWDLVESLWLRRDGVQQSTCLVTSLKTQRCRQASPPVVDLQQARILGQNREAYKHNIFINNEAHKQLNHKTFSRSDTVNVSPVACYPDKCYTTPSIATHGVQKLYYARSGKDNRMPCGAKAVAIGKKEKKYGDVFVTTNIFMTLHLKLPWLNMNANELRTYKCSTLKDRSGCNAGDAELLVKLESISLKKSQRPAWYGSHAA